MWVTPRGTNLIIGISAADSAPFHPAFSSAFIYVCTDLVATRQMTDFENLFFSQFCKKKCWRSSLRRPTYSLASVVNPDPLFLQWILSKIYSFNVLRLEMKMIAKVSPARLSGGRKWCRSRLRRPTYSLVAHWPSSSSGFNLTASYQHSTYYIATYSIEVFENTQWRKVKQMQPMWLYNTSKQEIWRGICNLLISWHYCTLT